MGDRGTLIATDWDAVPAIGRAVLMVSDGPLTISAWPSDCSLSPHPIYGQHMMSLILS
jgi:hypothetical protein